MEIFKAIVLGVVEGLTEFLPISSTGHLIVAEDMLNYYDASKMFAVVIQSGAIAAVVWFYRKELSRLFRGLIGGDEKIIRFWKVWIAATIPASLMGLFFSQQLEKYSLPLTVAIALILGGIAILSIEKYNRIPKSGKEAKLEELTFKQAVKIGLYQILALIPGVSRSGATIMGGLLSGVDRVTATAFSFYLGIPILLLAGIYKLSTGEISSIPGGSLALVAGLVSSFITALFVVGWLLRYVSRHDFKVFAWYRIGFGLFLLILLAVGSIG